MNERDIQGNIARANAVAAKYGYDSVPASEVYGLFDRLSELPARGFTAVKPGLYCQPIDDSIVRVIKLQAWKGGVYSPVWGVSLSFMPHAWDPKLRWHKGAKAARLDLFERGGNWAAEPSEARAVTDIGGISTLHGARYAYLTCSSVWTRRSPGIFRWFEGVTRFDDVLSVAQRQCESHDGRYDTHFPNPKLVVVFTLARLGRVQEAWAAFEKYPVEWETEVGRSMLANGLKQVCSGERE